MTKTWDYQLDFVRIIAALFVIVVHTVANSVLHSTFAYYSDLVASSGIFMFVILSGATNSLRYRRMRRGPGYNHLFKPAMTKLLGPYIFWTIVFMGINLYIKQQPVWTLHNLTKLGFNLWAGNAWFHLYFMVLLIYLYLTYGFLFELLKRFRVGALTFFGLSPIGITYLVNQVKMPAYLNHFLFLSPLNWWGILFMVGILWGLYFKPKDWVHHWKLQGMILLMIGGYLWLYLTVNSFFKASDSTGWYTLMMYLRGIYAFLAVLFFYGIGYYCLHHFQRWQQPVKKMGRHVYTLYFCHPVIICIWDQLQQQQVLPQSNQTSFIWLKLGIILVASIVLTYLIDGIKDLGVRWWQQGTAPKHVERVHH